tara:strand:+ start:1075 stop:1464 length:390 start_codon:yes stop_codon:yes gene_type:complete
MDISGLFRKFFFYFFTSGLIISLALTFLEYVSKFYSFVNVFAFASASFFLINLMQYNVVAESNPLAVKGFLIHTILGVLSFLFFSMTMLILHSFKYSRSDIITIMLSLIVITFVTYLYSYKKGFLDFLS